MIIDKQTWLIDEKTVIEWIRQVGRAPVGWRSVGGRWTPVGGWSEVGWRLGGGWSEVDRAPVGGRLGAGRRSALVIEHDNQPCRQTSALLTTLPAPDQPPTGARLTSDRLRKFFD